MADCSIPVPIAPTFRDFTDLTIAVNLNGEPGALSVPSQSPATQSDAESPESKPPPGKGDDDIHSRIREFLDDIGNNLKFNGADDGDELGVFELVARSFETMQNAISAMKLAAYAPDVTINVPRDVCDAHEFHRARELIGIGYRLAEEAMRGAR